MEWHGPDGYHATDDPSRVDVARLHRWLNDEYWAQGRTLEVVARSVAHSLTITVLDVGDAMVGFARWVSDQATFAWLSDVVVDPAHRGRGVGRFLLRCAMEHPAVADDSRLLLATRDAQWLYEPLGFAPVPPVNRLMESRRRTDRE